MRIPVPEYVASYSEYHKGWEVHVVGGVAQPAHGRVAGIRKVSSYTKCLALIAQLERGVALRNLDYSGRW